MSTINKLVNKNYFTVFIALSLVIILTMTRCNDEFEIYDDPVLDEDVILLTMDLSELMNKKAVGEYWNSHEANIIANRFLTLKEGKYSLGLTYEDAVDFHINVSDFERMLNELKTTNETLDSLRKDDSVILELPEPNAAIKDFIKKKSKPNKSFAKLKSGEEIAEDHVTFSTNGLEWNGAYVFLPIWAKTPLDVHCYYDGLTPLFNIYTKTMGIKEYKSGVGVLGQWSTTAKVYVTNDYCTCAMSTSNSNGATATFSWTPEE